MNQPAEKGGVVLDNVSKSYGASVVIDGCSFEVPTSEFTALIGPSGCGKTTIINLIAGYDVPDTGRLTIGRKPITGASRDRLVVFQETALFPWKTAIDNVAFGPLNYGVSRQESRTRARDLLAKFGLGGFELKYPAQLSGGMQRRVELARAMINSPEVMLLDEPFRGLDAMTRELMQEYLLRVFEENPLTTLFVTTEIEEAIYLADRIVILSSRPTVVKEVVTVDLPRPRKLQMLSSSRFSELYGRLLESLVEEAEKVYGEGVGSVADVLKSIA